MIHQPPSVESKQLLRTFAALSGRIGILGGTFDPVHNGHLELARQARRHHQLDRVIFMPAGVNPLKAHPPEASDAQRLQMLLLAIQDEAQFYLSAFEIERGGKSFTVDTLEEIRRQAVPEAELFLLGGADCYESLVAWKNHSRLFELASIALVPRNGKDSAMFEQPCGLSPAEIAHLKRFYVPMLEMPLSASAIRCAAGMLTADSLPAAVLEFIRFEHLYSF